MCPAPYFRPEVRAWYLLLLLCCHSVRARAAGAVHPHQGARRPDQRFVYVSDVLPTSWQAVEYAGIPDGGSAAIYGLWPVGDMSSRIARHRGYRVIAVDLVAERIERACRNGVEVIVANDHDVPGVIREMTDGRNPTR